MNGVEGKFGGKDEVHIIAGADAVLDMLINIIDKSEETVDIYSDFRVSVTRDTETINHFIAAQRRGVKIRVITEIAKNNLLFCKENMKYIEGLRLGYHYTCVSGIRETLYQRNTAK